MIFLLLIILAIRILVSDAREQVSLITWLVAAWVVIDICLFARKFMKERRQ
jgi:hypothetical protein